MLAVLLLAMGAVGPVSRDPPGCEETRKNLIYQPKTERRAARAMFVVT